MANMSAYLIYGATSYRGGACRTGSRGARPTSDLGGPQSTGSLASLAAELNLEHRVFSLADSCRLVDAGLGHVTAVLNCAGPFSHTALPLADACSADQDALPGYHG